MKHDELLGKLSPEAIAILQAAITPRIDTADITISSIDDGVIVTTTAAGVYRQLGPPWRAALTELWEHALITNTDKGRSAMNGMKLRHNLFRTNGLRHDRKLGVL